MKSQIRSLALILLTVAFAFLVYIGVAGLGTTGQHLFVISLARLGFLVGLGAIVAASRRQSRLLYGGFTLAVVAAVFNLVGAISHIAIDGWAFDPFSGALAAAQPPVYSMIIGLTAVLFALGTILVAIGLLRQKASTRLAWVTLFAGVLYAVAIPLAALGHIIWTIPWLVLGLLMLATKSGTVRQQPTLT